MNVGNSAIEYAFIKGYRVNDIGEPVHRDRVVKTDKDKSGRFRFRIRDIRGKVVNVPIHRMVAYQKFGELIFTPGLQVRHLDNNYTNNEWDNIGVGTQSENMMDIPEKERIKKAIHAASFLSKKVMAGGIMFDSYSEAGRYFDISDNGIRKRIKLKWAGYSVM